MRLVDVFYLECHSDIVKECLYLKHHVRVLFPGIRLLHEGPAFSESVDVDAESRVPPRAEMVRRIAACDAATAGGYALSRPAEPQAADLEGADGEAEEAEEVAAS